MSALKRFFISMLGSMAAIWLSAILFVIIGTIFIIVAISSASGVSVKVDDNSVLVINLAGVVEERPAQNDMMEELYGVSRDVMPLNQMIAGIKAAKDDDRIEGIFIQAKDINAGIASLQALQQALADFKKSGKWIVAYGDSYSQADYYLASVADELYINPVGSVDLHGLSATTFFYKGLLDKVGVEMQVVKVGQFKSAVEPFILTEMSEASRLQQQVFLDNIWADLSQTIADNRGVTVSTVNQWADSIIMCDSPQYYVENKIVDSLSYRHQVIDLLKEKCGIDKDDSLNSVNLTDYAQVADIPHIKTQDDRIAILYACGDITESADGGISSDVMVPMILNLAEDDDIRGMVLRVNSGGGSAFASEQIWEALEQFKEAGKTLYVSMGDYAASGGYYISCGASQIYAQSGTLTGSIGIFGLIPSVKGLLNEHLGITTGTVSTNANGDFMSLTEPMTPVQYARMQSEIERGYDTFTGRCAEGRHMPVDSIKAIAEGRVWDGAQAMRLGLVDKIGGLDMAVSDLASELGLKKYQIVEYPRQDATFFEMLLEQEELEHRAIKARLGDAYQIYEQANRILELAPRQCRMERIIVK